MERRTFPGGRKVAFFLTALASLAVLAYGLHRGEALKALINGALL